MDDVDVQAREAAKNIWRAALLGDAEMALNACVQARAVMQESVEYALLIRLPWAVGAEDDPAVIRLRSPCSCGHTHGAVRKLKGQHVVRCAACQAYQYCAARSEVGR